MEGTLKTMPLVGLLEMLHSERKSGVLYVEGVPPLTLRLQSGEIVGGGILDWEGIEAITTFRMHDNKAPFRFEPSMQSGKALLPFEALLGEWARINDECNRFLQIIDSPSRVFETLGNEEHLEVFIGGRSVRGAARRWQVPLIIALERVWLALKDGELTPLNRYAWYGLRIRHPQSRRKPTKNSDLIGMLDGSNNLGQLVAAGIEPNRLRRYLVKGILTRNLTFPGRGWLLRDLLWELDH